MIKDTCEVCQGKHYKILNVREMMFGTKHVFQYLLCKNCNSLTLQNIPENLGNYYPENYYSFAEESRKGLKGWIKNQTDAYSLGQGNILGLILSGFFVIDSNLKAIKLCNPDKEKTAILDIGCGGGALLKKLQKYGFKKLNGIDPYLDQDIISESISIKKVSIDQLLEDRKKYDVVIMSHVLEHLDDPNQHLQKVKSLLADHGKLIIRVPISSSAAFEKYANHWFQIDAPRHLFIPSLKGMYLLGEQQNLKVKNSFFDSMSIQFTASINYSNDISLKEQENLTVFERLSPKRLYYSLLSKKLNKQQKGDQATFIFIKK
ncbi:class I SAM-dependent methyltransferase [Aquimarina sp. M1]